MNMTCEGDPPLACCILPEIAFPASWTNGFQMRQISRVPSLSLRIYQQINRSSQYRNSLQTESMFSITSVDLCSPWSSLSLCLRPLKAPFMSTTVVFPCNYVVAWPGYTALNLLGKSFQLIIIFMLLSKFLGVSLSSCALDVGTRLGAHA